jgi:hypothetical protein
MGILDDNELEELPERLDISPRLSPEFDFENDEWQRTQVSNVLPTIPRLQIYANVFFKLKIPENELPLNRIPSKTPFSNRASATPAPALSRTPSSSHPVLGGILQSGLFENENTF